MILSINKINKLLIIKVIFNVFLTITIININNFHQIILALKLHIYTKLLKTIKYEI